eukprot:gene7956-12423_t
MSKSKEHYVIRFEALFKYKDIGSIYYKFLKGDHSEESWEFLTELKKISEEGEKDSKPKIEKLVELYINDGAKKEINISYETKKHCLEQLKLEQNVEVFQNIQSILINEMKYDSFKRFVRSKACHEVLEKYKSNKEVCQPVLSTKFNYRNEDFVEQRVLEEDLKFMDILYKDSPQWELLTSFKDGKALGNSFWSIENYIPDVTIAPCVSVAKYDLILPYSFEHVLCSFYPLAEQIKFDPQCAKYETFDYKKDEQGNSHSTILYNVTFDYPLNCRFYPMVASGSYDPEIKKCVQIFKPCEIDILKDHPWMQERVSKSVQRKGQPEVVKKTYKMYDFQSTHIQKLDDQRTTFTQIHLYALGGWITNKSFMKKIAKSRGQSLLKDLVANIKKTSSSVKLNDLNKAETFKEDGLAQILFDLQIPKRDADLEAKRDYKKEEKEDKETEQIEQVEEPSVDKKEEKEPTEEINEDSIKLVNECENQ